MDAIRKTMQKLKQEKDSLEAAAARFEASAAESNAMADKCDAAVRELGKRIGTLEGGLDTAVESLNKTMFSLEDKEKHLATAEEEVGAQSRRLVLMEFETKEADTRLGDTVRELATRSKDADAILKKVKFFESKTMRNEVTIEEQERELRSANIIVADSEKKLDEITRRLDVMEDESRRAVERADLAEAKLVAVENELKNVGDNMKALEVSEEKAVAREEKFMEQIRALMQRLKEADKRAEYGEMNITKLNIRIDDIEDEIVREKLRLKKVCDELGDTFDEMLTKY